MKKTLKALTIALACLMSTQVAMVFAMEKENKQENKKNILAKRPGSCLKKFCRKNTSKLIIGVIAATGFITAAILKNKPIAIGSCILAGLGTIYYLGKYLFEKFKNFRDHRRNEYINSITGSTPKKKEDSLPAEESLLTKLFIPSKKSTIGKLLGEFDLFGYGEKKDNGPTEQADISQKRLLQMEKLMQAEDTEEIEIKSTEEIAEPLE